MDNVIRDTQQVETDTFPCPGCGGNMVFQPETQSLSCPYCGNTVEIPDEDGEIFEYDLESAGDTASHNWGQEKRIIKCDSCGAETILDAHTTAQFCAFCGASHITQTEETVGIAPESLIPFNISRKDARGRFKKWIQSRFFAPNALKKEHQSQRLTGVYVPCWTYDASTHSTYRAQAGHYYYVTETVTKTVNGKTQTETRQVRKIRWFPVSGFYGEDFDDVLVNASSQIDPTLMSKLSPFHLKELVKYKPEFLSGFLAERYSVELKEGWNQAVNLIKQQIRLGITRKINADEVRNLRVQTNYQNIKYKHILLPIWISSYKYKNKVYSYLINGQTGEVQGHAPLSPLKIGIAILAGLAVIGTIYMLVR